MRTWIVAAVTAALSLHAAVAHAGPPLVGAYYYPWYTPQNPAHAWSVTLRDNLVPAQQPAEGYYNSEDESVISQQIAYSREANISFWASSWWGPGSEEDVALKDDVLTNPNASQLKYAIQYETAGRLGSPSDPTWSNLTSDFKYLAQTYFHNPNYLTINGRPVVFIYLTRAYFNGTTAATEAADIRIAVERVTGVDPYLIGDDIYPGQNSSTRARLWDAVTDEDVYGSVLQTHGSTHAAVTQLASQYQAAATLAHGDNIGFIPTVEPGFNDTATRTGHTPAPRYETDVPGATEGSLFADELKTAVLPHVDPKSANIMMVNSFNEWQEDTQIEPVAAAAPTSRSDGTFNGYGTPSTGGSSYTGYGNLYLNDLAAATHAYQSTWSGASGGAWNNAANWISGAGPGLDPYFATTDTVTFGNTTGSVTVDLVNANPSLNSIVFNKSGSYSIVASGGGGITLAGTSATISVAGTHSIAAPLTWAADVTVNVNGSSDRLTISGGIGGNYELTKLGAGTLTLTGARSLGAGTMLAVGGTGAMRINARAAGSVAAGAVVTVGSSATLELDGGVSALVDPTANITSGAVLHPTQRAAIKNDGVLSIVSTGAHQVQEVGGIDPNTSQTGSVVVNAKANLIADHINQSSLVIGSGATLTIAPSGANGNPMAGLSGDFALAGSLAPDSGFLASNDSLLDADSSTSPAAVSLEGGTASASAAPEPSSIIVLISGLFVAGWRVLLKRQRISLNQAATPRRSPL
jgi:glycoprotein endo-alpha-1,2-mannosidase